MKNIINKKKTNSILYTFLLIHSEHTSNENLYTGSGKNTGADHSLGLVYGYCLKVFRKFENFNYKI